ncbi:flagellar basal body protein [Massilia putida]|uniref:flagellar basal body protein n=1 Tax=Massilia putida TaxID=1141883 RepID=UPI0027D81504|nr:flagellar basal body protein [Massilia putida]
MSLLSIGKSGLYAAQAALATTGNNITNANVAGYSREAVVQAASTSMGGPTATSAPEPKSPRSSATRTTS